MIELRCLSEGKRPIIRFGTYEELRKLAPKIAVWNKDGYDIYFGANPRAGKSTKKVSKFNALFVDLDKISVDDAESQLKSAIQKYLLPDATLCVMSGGGVHFYWKLKESLKNAKEWTILQKRLIKCFPNADKCIHDAPRIMRLPGFVNHKNGKTAEMIWNKQISYDLQEFEDIPSIESVEPPQPQNTQQLCDSENGNDNYARAIKYFSMRDGVGKGERNNACFRVAICCLNDFELSEPQAYNIISEWNQKNSPALPQNELKGILKKAMEHARTKGNGGSKNRMLTPRNTSYEIENPEYIPDNVKPITADTQIKTPAKQADMVDFSVVAEMLERYIIVIGSTDVWDLYYGIKMSVASLKLLYPSEYKYWLRDANRQAILQDNLAFRPNGKVGKGQINTFQGFNFKRDERYPTKLISHLEFLCNNDPGLFNWVVSWMALQVQRPGTKLATSIIMHGTQGTGKSMFWQTFADIFKPYSITINQAILESDFNPWSSRKVFVLAEEVLANRSKSRLKNIIKEMITGGTIIINQKHQQPWQEDCFMNMVFLSNNKLPMLLDKEDRRFTVIKINNKESESYYNELANEIADNGANRLYNFLMNWDLDGFNAHSKPYLTDEKESLIMLAKDSSILFLDEWLNDEIDGLPCIPCTRNDLYDAYREWCSAGRYRVDNRHSFYSVIYSDYANEIQLVKYQGSMIFHKPDATGHPMDFNSNLKSWIKQLAGNMI